MLWNGVRKYCRIHCNAVAKKRKLISIPVSFVACSNCLSKSPKIIDTFLDTSDTLLASSDTTSSLTVSFFISDIAASFCFFNFSYFLLSTKIPLLEN